MNLAQATNRFLPFLRWGRRLDKPTVRADFLAGLTGAAIVLPQGVAFATIAGMPPQYGLYASMVPAIIAALFGSSRHLVSGPTTAASIVMFSSLSVMATPGSEQYIALALTLTFMVGITQFLMGVARLGELVNFISHSVIIGFTAGAAALIAAKQAKNFLGVETDGGSNLYQTLANLVVELDHIQPLVTVVAVATLLTGAFAGRVLPKIPPMIAALMVGSFIAVVLNNTYGADQTGIRMIGALPKTFPPLSAPEFDIQILKDLAPVALAMTLFALTEAVSIARSIAIRSGQAISGNQEFIGQGLSNIIGSFFSGYVATGSFNRSGANYDAGAKTPLAAIFAGSILLAFIPILAPLTAYLPVASVAGLLVLVAWRLIDFAYIRKVVNADRSETLIMAVTFASTLFLELEFALLLGVILSLMFYLRRTSRPKLLARSPDPRTGRRKFTAGMSLPECPQLKILRLEDSLYFGSVAYVGELLRLYREHYPEQKNLFLLTKGVNQVDLAGAELLINEARERRAMGGEFYMYRMKATATHVLESGGFMEELDRGTIFDSKDEAIKGIFDKLDKSICATCDRRIFLECDSVPYQSDDNVIDIIEVDESPADRANAQVNGQAKAQTGPEDSPEDDQGKAPSA